MAFRTVDGRKLCALCDNMSSEFYAEFKENHYNFYTSCQLYWLTFRIRRLVYKTWFDLCGFHNGKVQEKSPVTTVMMSEKKSSNHSYDVWQNNVISTELVEFFITDDCNFHKYLKVRILTTFQNRPTFKTHGDMWNTDFPTKGKG